MNTLDPAGMAWAALGGIGWGCYIIFGRRVGHLPIGITAPLGAAMAALVVVPVGIAHAGAALLFLGAILSFSQCVAHWPDHAGIHGLCTRSAGAPRNA